MRMAPGARAHGWRKTTQGRMRVASGPSIVAVGPSLFGRPGEARWIRGRAAGSAAMMARNASRDTAPARGHW